MTDTFPKEGVEMMAAIVSANAAAAASMNNQLISSANLDAAKWAERFVELHSYMSQAIKSGNMFQIVHTIEAWNYTLASAHEAIEHHTKMAERMEDA
jgi:hypothetical protein